MSHELPVAHWVVVDGKLQESVEDHPSTPRSASVEAKGELIEIVLEMCVVDTTLMRAEVPPLDEGGTRCTPGSSALMSSPRADAAR
jgi:hypothetical protein